MQIPLALAYDTNDKHLFIGDGMHNRILVFDAHPGRLKTYDEAIAVLGQPGFKTSQPGVGPDRMNFGVAWGRGIQSTAPTPLALEVDPKNQRLFISDGINHRVLVFDIHPGKVRTGASAIAVVGQPDFESNPPTPRENARAIEDSGALSDRIVQGRAPANNRGFDTPSGLAYDVNNDRLFVTDSFWARLVVFDLPRTEKPVKVRARSMTSYSTVDAWKGRNMPVLDQSKQWRGELTRFPAAAGAVLVYSNTRQEMDKLSKRRSRTKPGSGKSTGSFLE